jgi:hypothetical protein
MRKLSYLALTAFALAGTQSAVQAQDLRSRITPRPTLPGPITTSMSGAEPTTPPPQDSAAPATPSSPCAASAACCASCGAKGGGTIRHVIDWLCYRALPTNCKTKGCCANSCPPPAYAFFPCQSGGAGCEGCANGPANGSTGRGVTVYYTKAADGPAVTEPATTEPVNQTGLVAAPSAKPQDDKSTKAATSEYHPTTYKPGNIAKTMPVLPPSLFRTPPQAGNVGQSN